MARLEESSVSVRRAFVRIFESRSSWLARARPSRAACLVSITCALGSNASLAEEQAASSPAERRQIEEVVVTAERKEASISDTSISITAFTGQMLEDLGIRNQEDLQNMIPAAVIQPYDMAIRGI